MPPNARLIDVAWGDGAGSSLARGLLTPAEWLYRTGVAVRNRLFDTGVLAAHDTAVPAISIGNLSVGGTGKTPIASFVAGRLLGAGARPAIVLRGYGGDEGAVHAVLQPGVEVITAPDRVAGAVRARAAGCDVAVFDDAFQHRRARRVVDAVLVSADVPWTTHCLPAGPLREPWTSLRRADLVIVTRKAATDEAARAVEARVAALGVRAVAHVALRLDRLRDAAGRPGTGEPLEALRGRTVLAIAGIGNPGAFFSQLHNAGALVIPDARGDHHAYSDTDVRALHRRADSAEFVVCTLKDAVKLGRHWPRSGPTLWYVSQRVDLLDGAKHLHDAVARLLAARSPG